MTQNIPLDLIDQNPFQPRLNEDAAAVASLADSIERNGLLQIPSARAVNGRYQLAFGHTRKAAFDMLSERDRAKFGGMPLNIVELTDLQMFEAAVSENIQRRDLNPVEVAQAMKRYMQDFGKTSDECGTFFGVNGATVRGKVRLLDLPTEAQKRLASGEISEGTARSLLTLAKLADEKAIKETLNEIKTAGPEGDPNEIIENAIDHLDNVKEMWPHYRDGKPRAGMNLWPLDMKNFPNKMLEHLAPGDYIEIGLVKRDELTKAHTDYSLGNKDADLPVELKAKIDHLVNPPACTACPFYTVINKTHYCGLRVCWERKAQAYIAQKLADASRTLKIENYQESDGPYMALDEIHTTHKKAFEARHADLRLLPTEKFKGYVYQNFKGLDRGVATLVVVGESINKLAVRGSKSVGKKTEKEKAEMRAMRLYRQRRKELLWEYTAAAQELFAGLSMETLKKIRNWHFVGIDDRLPEEHDHPNIGTKDEMLEFARRDLVWALIVGETSHYTRDELTDYLDSFADLTGVKAPKALVKKAQEWDAEIAELAKPAVAVETKGKKK